MRLSANTSTTGMFSLHGPYTSVLGGLGDMTSTDSNGNVTVTDGAGNVTVTDSYGNLVSYTPAASTVTPSALSTLFSSAPAAVTGILQAENAQNLINQEKTLAGSITNMLPYIVGGVFLLFFLNGKKS